MWTNEQLLTVAETFALLGDLSRLRIILACLTEETCVSTIARQLNLSQSLVSHHLRLLRAVGLIARRKDGKHVFYRVADDHVRTLLEQMLTHTTECEPANDEESCECS